jgi:peptidoglycan/xylan/chitin deacetylase (PgdA/CDA1 family)
MSAARGLLRAAQRLLPAERGGLTVLAYHLVGAGTGSPVDLPAELFRRQLDELAEHARPVGLTAAVAALAAGGQPDADGGAPPPQDPRAAIAVTFDDAYRNFATHAWPLLAERGIPATLFVPVGFLDGGCPAPIRGTDHLPPIPWAELRELVAAGLAVGSHTWSHPDLTRLPAAQVRDELRRSRAALEDRLGVPVTAFCYPRGLWSRHLEPLVGEVYELAVVGGGGKLSARRLRPLRIQRVPLRADGPASLIPLLGAPVWLEERVADTVRRHVRRSGPDRRGT